MEETVLGDIERAMADLEIESVKSGVKEALKANISAMDIVNAIGKGLVEVGVRYEKNEYFLMELLVSGNLAIEILEMLKPYFPHEDKYVGSAGKVVIGTVSGDLHTIGKNIVVVMMQSAGFSVLDLGEDVPAEKFVEAVKTQKFDVLALSGLLTIIIGEMRHVIEELENAGLRDKVKVIVGGRPLTNELAKEIGADGYGKDAIEAISLVKRLLKGNDQDE